ncbi:MAG: dynamin family protein [Lachnospiraceae bacterium]|nr:dynamin family protein [Lachnospiraceae bacterium]
MADFKFNDEILQKKYDLKVQELKKIADEKIDDTAYLWDETVKRYATSMERVKRILETEGMNEQVTSNLIKHMSVFLKKCSNAEFHIALVGAIKAGKSTLINALLGYEYASTKVTPETAALTKFRRGDRNYVKVSFYRKNEWAILYQSAVDSKATVFLEEYSALQADREKDKWLGNTDQMFDCEDTEKLVKEIERWTSSKSACHYFVKEVEVGLKDFELPDGVVLVDTPGLDDVVEYRSNITREYIDRANAVLVCVKSDSLTGQEMATIYSVFSNTRYNPEKVYIIATQLDTLNRPSENWKEQQKEWLKYLKGAGAYGSLELAKRNLIPVSAYLYTLLKEYNTYDENSDKMFDLESILLKLRIRNINEHFQELLDFTNIDLLKTKINREIVSNYKKLLIADIADAFTTCREELRETLGNIKNNQKEIIQTSKGGIKEIKKKQAEYAKKYQEAEEDKKEMDALLKSLQIATSKRADDLEKAIKGLNR